jgi:guanylate kinase
VGKGTLIRALLERMPGLELSVSATTRAPRPGEVEGRDYRFLTDAEFDRLLEAGAFLEHATYAGNRYGTLRSEIERAAGAGEPRGGELRGVVLEIELQGARQVRSSLPEALQVFIAPPSIEALRERLAARGSDSEEQIADRLRTAEEELRASGEWEHVVVNDRLERAVEELERLVATIWGAGGRPAKP